MTHIRADSFTLTAVAPGAPHLEPYWESVCGIKRPTESISARHVRFAATQADHLLLKTLPNPLCESCAAIAGIDAW